MKQEIEVDCSEFVIFGVGVGGCGESVLNTSSHFWFSQAIWMVFRKERTAAEGATSSGWFLSNGVIVSSVPLCHYLGLIQLPKNPLLPAGDFFGFIGVCRCFFHFRYLRYLRQWLGIPSASGKVC